MKMHVLLFALLALVLSSEALALQYFSGNTISIDDPIDDDVFALGSSININAPVESAIVVGGNVNVNAPVRGDLIVSGGQVLLSSNVGGKVIALGGNLNMLGNVTRNLVAAGGQVDLHRNMTVGKDAFIGGGDIYSSATINGTLTVNAESFEDKGHAGLVRFHQTERRDEGPAEHGISIFGLIMSLGYLIAGLILLRLFPNVFMTLDEEIRSSLGMSTMVGFLGLIVSFVLAIIFMMTVVGAPLSLLTLLFLIIGVMLSGLFVSFGLGRAITMRLKKDGPVLAFVIGFIILNILYQVPYIGWLASLITTSLGFGALIYALIRWHKGQAAAT